MLNLFAVALVDLGIAGMLVGLLSIVSPLKFLHIHSRTTGVVVFGASLAVVVTGMLLPAPIERVVVERSDLDRAMPEWQFHERHQRRVNAPPEAVYRAIQSVTADDILLFRTLTWIRSPHLGADRDGGNILRSPRNPTPLIDVVLRSGFIKLSERPSRELVLGTVVAGPVRAFHGERTAENFIRLSAPGFAKATINFLVEPAGGVASEVITETRVFGTDARAARSFGAYWRVIYPGSALIRIMWLRAIKLRAEGGSGRQGR
jgi:hypothetical protein